LGGKVKLMDNEERKRFVIFNAVTLIVISVIALYLCLQSSNYDLILIICLIIWCIIGSFQRYFVQTQNPVIRNLPIVHKSLVWPYHVAIFPVFFLYHAIFLLIVQIKNIK
jgi:hypothetical protein